MLRYIALAGVVLVGAGAQAQELSDYPTEALTKHQQGNVDLTFDLDSSSKVTRCRALHSSGSEALDEASCRIVQRAAPEWVQAGRAVAGVRDQRLRIRWIIPGEPLTGNERPASSPTLSITYNGPAIGSDLFQATPPKSRGGEPWLATSDYPTEELRLGHGGAILMTLQVDAEGAVSGCSVVRSTGWPVLDQTSCALIKSRARFSPALNPSGAPIPSIQQRGFVWDPAQAAQPHN